MSAVLFVCLGNICRSPTAEGVTRALADRAGLDLTIDSAGTGDWHVGEPPYGPAQDAAAERGYDLSAQRARQVSPEDFGRFDLILAMDGQNLADLRRLAPQGARARLALFTDWHPEPGVSKVPDPYYTRDFEGALDLVEAAAEALVKDLSAGSEGRP